jgi:hypothetical protein
MRRSGSLGLEDTLEAIPVLRLLKLLDVVAASSYWVLEKEKQKKNFSRDQLTQLTSATAEKDISDITTTWWTSTPHQACFSLLLAVPEATNRIYMCHT